MIIPHGFFGEMIGAYRVQHVLGRGRLSTLHLAQHPISQQTVALTTITASSQLTTDEQQIFLSRFMQEISVLSTLRHPHILAIDDYGEQDGIPYFVLPAIIGNTLQERLRQGIRWNPATTIHLLRQVADALDYAHLRGVVHGGLKPACILLEPDNNIHVTGFGLERFLSRYGIDEEADHSWVHLLSVTGSFLGQLEYMAPECVQGAAASIRSDIYALGCILFALLNGEPPIKGTPFEMIAQQIQMPELSLRNARPRLKPRLCEVLDKVLQKALSPDPLQRHNSAGEFIEAFTQAFIPYHKLDNFYEEEEEEATEPTSPLPDESQVVDAQAQNQVTLIHVNETPAASETRAEIFRQRWQQSTQGLPIDPDQTLIAQTPEEQAGTARIVEAARDQPEENLISRLQGLNPDETFIARPRNNEAGESTATRTNSKRKPSSYPSRQPGQAN